MIISDLFFQAEDGIRVLVRSRGLGDVYKRQAEAGVPPYVIFHDSALGEMASYYPQSAEALSQMQGVGAVKLARYGDAFLRVIRAYCEVRSIAEKPKVVALTRTTRVPANGKTPVSYTHLRAHETVLDLVCRLLLEKKKNSTALNRNYIYNTHQN